MSSSVVPGEMYFEKKMDETICKSRNVMGHTVGVEIKLAAGQWACPGTPHSCWRPGVREVGEQVLHLFTARQSLVLHSLFQATLRELGAHRGRASAPCRPPGLWLSPREARISHAIAGCACSCGC